MLADFGNFIGEKLNNLFDSKITDATIEELLGDIMRELINANVNPRLLVTLRNNINIMLQDNKILDSKNKLIDKNANNNYLARNVRNAVFKCLSNFLDPKTEVYKIEKGKQNIVVFVGLQGAGKTTSICKYALYYKKKGFKVGIVCADTFRAGAYDQVKQNAEKINVPFFGLDEADPVKVAKAGVTKFRKNDFELILVDTSGRHTQEESLFVEMKDIVINIVPDNIVFVMDAGIGQSAYEQALGFKKAVEVGGIILTKLDGAAKAGGALSSVAATECPIEFIGTGEKMDDFEKFNANFFVSKLLNITNFETIAEKLEDMDLDPEQMTNKMMKGEFTLGDFRHFYTQFCSLGSITSMIRMMPGLNNVNLPDEKKLKRLNYIFDSMEQNELNSTGEIFNDSRIRRVALGSGTSKEAVGELLQNFKSMRSMAKKILQMPGMAEMMGMTIDEKDKKQKKTNKKYQINDDFIKQMQNMNDLF